MKNSEYDQEIPQSQTVDKFMASRGRAMVSENNILVKISEFTVCIRAAKILANYGISSGCVIFNKPKATFTAKPNTICKL